LHDPLDTSEALFASNDLDAREARRDVIGLLDRLPDKQRLPILHVKLEGLSVAETARRTGLSESAVKVGIHRGLTALARRLAPSEPGHATEHGAWVADGALDRTAREPGRTGGLAPDLAPDREAPALRPRRLVRA